jgi:PAS domain S-box-containing protein
MNIVKSTFFQIIKRKESLIFLVLFIAGLSLFGWLFDLMSLSSFSPKYIPIPPSSVVMFITLSILFLINKNFEKSQFAKSLVTLFVIIDAFYCSIIFLEYLFKLSWDIEYILIKNPERFGDVPIGRMSPITALLFIFICISILGIRKNNTAIIKYIGGSFALLTGFISLVLLIGYLYKAPLLYGSKIIPVSLPSAICFFLFSITLLRIVEVKFWTLNLIRDNKITRQLLKSFLPIVVSIIILQGFLITNFSFHLNNPTLSVAVILFIVIIITILIVYRVSAIEGAQIESAEQALGESEKKYRTLVENVGEGIGFVNLDEEFLLANSAAERIFGVGKGELLGKNLKEFLSEDQYMKILNQTKIRKEGQSSTYEFELTRTDGKKRNVFITAVPQFNDNNKFIGTHGIFIDFTERKNMEEALRESESSLQNAQEIAKMGSWELDITNQKVKWSENCFGIYGLKPFEIEPTFEYFKSRVHPDDLHLVDESFENTVRHKATYIPEMRIIFPDGTFKWFQTNIVPIFQDDKLIALHGVNLDITERKQVERAIKESETKFKEVINQINDGIIVFDESRKVIIWNSGAEEITGLKAIDTINIDFADIVYQLNPSLYKEKSIIENRIKAIASLELPAVFNKISDVEINDVNTGKLKNIQQIIFQIRFDSYNLFCAVLRDTTKIKEYEKQLLQLSIDKDRFLSILGHDLRSPFTALLGLSDILKENIQEFDVEEIKNMAGDINKTAQNTFNLLEDLLKWARSQQGKIPFKPENMTFVDICMDVTEVLKPSANAKNITINYNVANGIKVFADIDMLKTVLRNLVSNAIKFTNNSGSIYISAKQSNSNITITVSDNGIGINPDNLAKLFDVGQVITTKGTEDEKGTGLGLLLCKEFVEKHSGKIWVESEVGKGSEFKFTLPITISPTV